MTKEIATDPQYQTKTVLSTLALTSPVKQSQNNMKDLGKKFMVEGENVPVSSSLLARQKIQLKQKEKISNVATFAQLSQQSPFRRPKTSFISSRKEGSDSQLDSKIQTDKNQEINLNNSNRTPETMIRGEDYLEKYDLT